MQGFALSILLHLICFCASAQRIDYSDYDFERADSVAISLKGVKGYSIEKLAVALTHDLDTDVEKIRAIYRWIAENIEYDVVEYHKLYKVRSRASAKRQKRYFTKSAKNISRRTLRKGRAICYGYSYLFAEMAASIGIASHLVGGYSRGYGTLVGKAKRPDHAWNIVYLDQQWYPIDVTWSSGYTNRKVTKFDFHFNDFYFLTQPEIFIKNHYPQDPMWTMIYEPLSLRDFFNAPIVLEGYAKNKMNKFFPESGVIRSNADSTINFSFTSNRGWDLKKVKVRLLSLKESEAIKDISPISQELTKTDHDYNFQFRFPRKGRYRLLVEIDSKPTFIYDAYVK